MLENCIYHRHISFEKSLHYAIKESLSPPCPLLSLLYKKVLEGIVVIFVKCCIDERIKERIGVAKPKKDAFPDGWDVAGTEGTY